MNILMASDVYFPRVNGVSTSILTFRRALQQLGHRVTLLAPEYAQRTSNEQDILRVASRYLLLDPEDRMMRADALRRTARRLQNEPFDLLHVQTPFVAHYAGVRLAAQLGIPCVETYHTFFEEYLFHYVPLLPARLMRYVARSFTRRQCRQVDALVVPSRAMLEVLRRYGVQTPARVIPTGMELDQFQPGDGARFRGRYGIAAQRPVLVHIGRVAHEKNIGFLLQVLRALVPDLPDLLLIIAGEGPARASLQRYCHELGLHDNVLFVGYLERGEALWDCYSAGDAFVFASRTETQGLVLLEALALGVPVVSTAVMGTRDVLQPGCGALVAEEDVDDFAAKVRQVLMSAELRTSLGTAGRSYAQRWCAKRTATQLLTFYAEVVGGVVSRAA